MGNQIVPNPDPNIGFPIPTQPMNVLFPPTTPPPDPGTFEIGLVLGGTVSAAAYTAGVLDYLIEALDAWTVAKANGDPTAPKHNVIIKIISGTSGGGVTSVVLARALGFAFPHFTLAASGPAFTQNPFYDLWVNKLDISGFLETTDLAQGKIPSLLCATKLDLATANQSSNNVSVFLGQGGGQFGGFSGPELFLLATRAFTGLLDAQGIRYS